MKQSYESPALTTYGSVEKITQTGPWGSWGNRNDRNNRNSRNDYNYWSNNKTYHPDYKGSNDHNDYWSWCKKYFTPSGS